MLLEGHGDPEQPCDCFSHSQCSGKTIQASAALPGDQPRCFSPPPSRMSTPGWLKSRKQARHITEYRATRVDHASFWQCMNHQKLTPWVDPFQELPLSVLGAMLREHLHCRDEYQRGLFCLHESSLPLLAPARVFTSVNTSGSPFASADQCPQARLYRLQGGGWRSGCALALASGPCRYSQPQQPCSSDGN